MTDTLKADDWKNEYMRQIEDCMARDNRMTEWEQNFVQSLSEQLERSDGGLSQKQIDVLDRVWEKVTKNG